MSLTLVAVSLDDQPLSQPITAVFDARGGTIGRADHNTMSLPDPQRHVSRLQAEVVVTGHGFFIRNVGAANPILVGSRSLAQGEMSLVGHDDVVRIGGYLLKARIGNDEATRPPIALERTRPTQTGAPVPVAPAMPPAMLAARLDPPFAPPSPPVPPAPAPAPARAPAADPFADLLGPGAGAAGGGSSNPFADLLGAPAPAPVVASAAPPPVDPFADLMPPMQGVAARSAAVAPPPPPVARLPDDFDPFAPPPARPAAAAAAPVDPFADLMGAAPPPSIDAAFGLGAGAPDPLADFLGGPAPPAPGGPALSNDPLAMFGTVAPPPPPAPLQEDRLPAINAAFVPPRPAPRTVAAPPAAPVPVAAPPAGGPTDDALWRAFCEGAGISPALPSALPPAVLEQQMRNVGRVMRSAIAGTLQLIAVRASTKHELRAGVTVIQQRSNNPLKFTPDAATALEQLVQPPLRGFLDGPAAMDDAMSDLVGHSIGTVAGLRAAVEGMLDRFAPEALERKLVGGGVMDSLLPMARKARLWELYLQHHQSIREEAQEDFHTLFGKAFLAAYEQQVERLKREAGKR